MAIELGDTIWPRSQEPGSEWMDLRPPPWFRDALCREYPALEFVLLPVGVTAGAVEELKSVCRRCAVRPECLDYALADETLVGVFGGTTQKERRQYRRERPRTRFRGPRPGW